MPSFTPSGPARRSASAPSSELQALTDRAAFVAAHVARALQQKLRPALRDRMPRRYLELEEQRLTRLVTEWLDYESTRIEFEVIETEVERTIQLAGLTFNLRLDRIDRLNDNSLLVIDYKTGAVTPKSWQLPRPDDVQLPLYAGFAIDEEESSAASSSPKSAAATSPSPATSATPEPRCFPASPPPAASSKTASPPRQLIEWRATHRAARRDFLTGRAEVDPRDYPKTCEHCGLETLCRIAENRALLDPDEVSEDDAEAADE